VSDLYITLFYYLCFGIGLFPAPSTRKSNESFATARRKPWTTTRVCHACAQTTCGHAAVAGRLHVQWELLYLASLRATLRPLRKIHFTGVSIEPLGDRTVYTTYMYYTYILLPTEYWDSINKYGPTQWQHTYVCRWSWTMTSWQLVPTMNSTPSPSVGPAWIQPAASHPNFIHFFLGGGRHCYFSSSAIKPRDSQTFLLAELLLRRKITTDPHILAQVNMHCPDDTYAKLKIHISELILDRYIPVAYL
jgi:hypothetical protein